MAKEYPAREITLERSGIKVSVPDDWAISDTVAAQRAAGKNAEKFQLYLMQRVCRFNGRRQSMDWIEDNIGGKDGLQLAGALFGDQEAGADSDADNAAEGAAPKED